jgi:hypothetical protein
MGAVLSVMPAVYSTNKEVKLLDRKLGILYWICIMLVLGYVLGVRILIEGAYNAVEKSYGVVGVALNGTTHSLKGGVSVPQDVPSLLHFEEGNAIFLPTRVITSRDQAHGNCTDPDETCVSDSDCVREPPLAIGLCDHQHCTRYSWCNAGSASAQPIDPFKTLAPSTLAQTEEVLQGFDRLSIVLTGTTEFNLGSELTTEDGRQARTKWTLAQIIQRARLTEQQAQTSGAVLSVTLQWTCPNLLDDSNCVPHLLVTQLGADAPCYKQWATYHRRGSGASSSQYRDLYQARGLRLLFTSQGSGKRIDVLQVVAQLFVALALMPVRSAQPNARTPRTHAQAHARAVPAPEPRSYHLSPDSPAADCRRPRRHHHAAVLLRAAPLPRVQDGALARLLRRARQGRAAREAEPVTATKGDELRVGLARRAAAAAPAARAPH